MSTVATVPPALTIFQAIAARHGGAEVRWRNVSPNFPEHWKPRLEELMRLFGPHPAYVRCPEAMFVLPFDEGHVVIGRFADLDATTDQIPQILGFHFLLLSAQDYGDWGADPFALLDAMPPVWEQRQPLAESWTPHVHPRTVDEVCTVLKRADSPTFLGAVQALLDGSRIAWPRPSPETELLQCLWMLLPYANRRETWICSCLFTPQLDFHAVVAPAEVASQLDARYLSETQAAHYPEGHYELGLQIAAEKGDQAALDSLFNRRSRSETLRMVIWLLVGIMVTVLVLGFLQTLKK
jgi:hypothetical protein